MWSSVQKGNNSSLISDARRLQEGSRVNEWMEEGEAWTAPGGGWAKVNLRSLALVLSVLTYTATNSPAHRSSKQQESGLQSAEGCGGWGPEWDSRATLALSRVITPLQYSHIWQKTKQDPEVKGAAAHRPPPGWPAGLHGSPRLLPSVQTENSRLLCIICQGSSPGWGPWPTCRTIYLIRFWFRVIFQSQGSLSWTEE